MREYTPETGPKCVAVGPCVPLLRDRMAFQAVSVRRESNPECDRSIHYSASVEHTRVVQLFPRPSPSLPTSLCHARSAPQTRLPSCTGTITPVPNLSSIGLIRLANQ